MTYLKEWQDAKKAFETATGKKKPSESFLGVFRKSSGLESACKGLDDAIKKPTLDGLTKALMAFDKARLDYVKLLSKADASDKDGDYAKEIQKLENALEGIQKNYAQEMQEALQRAPRPLQDILGKHFQELTTNVLGTKASCKWFATAKELAVSGIDGSPLADAAKAQKDFTAEVQAYVKAVNDLKKAGKTQLATREGVAFASKSADDILSHIYPISEGAQYHFRMWVDAQETAFKKANKQSEFKAFMESGPLAAKLKAVGDDLTNESVRVTNALAAVEKLVR
ncbi:hypothetical protein [Arenibaculum pallidiluteum]|uniref:hypothetical protein n=1 Tax=Arenibaculum pallidiluteum TaxID=2812559 RepID=UPI001A96EB9B|nr:hypothetical protein [Arenibaculum pallidiluteum]